MFGSKNKSKISEVTLLAVCLMLSVGCGCMEDTGVEAQHPDMSWVGKELQGTHALYALENTTGLKGEVRGSYVMCIGGLSGQISTDPKVLFIWQNNRGEFQPASLPYEKVRFMISPTNTPSVKFRWTRSIADPMNAVIYAVFMLNPSQIVSNVNFDFKNN